ncbi:MAG: sugar ABC transporter permease, partial [Proteobacteria bacterium]|nr:sugar ABC transporter permease [Pseudomonadota bacterium]
MRTAPASAFGRLWQNERFLSLALVTPALLTIGALFLYPLGFSVISAFSVEDSGFGIANFTKAFDFYSNDILFTVIIVGISTVLIGAFAIAIGGYLTMGESPLAVSILKWLYRWPLFIPFIVAGQMMRTFLAKNGLMNNLIVVAGPLD